MIELRKTIAAILINLTLSVLPDCKFKVSFCEFIRQHLNEL